EFLAEDDPDLYLSNTIERTFPRGFDFEIFSAAALAEAHERATTSAEREHVTPYFFAGPTPRLRLRNVAWPVDKSGYRVTVATDDALAPVRGLIEDSGAAPLGCAEITPALDNPPDLATLNRHVQQKSLDS